MKNERSTRAKAQNIDWITIILVLGLFSFGLVTIANVWADPFTGSESGISGIMEKLNLEYVQKQAVNFMVGIAACLVMLAVDYNMFSLVIKWIYVGNIILLGILLVAAGSTRGVLGWFNIGTRAFQPSEICKITLILSLSKICSDAYERDGSIKAPKDILLAVGCFAIPFGLVVLQPDFGTAVVFLAIFVCILFISKISWKYIISALVALAAIAPLSYYYILSDSQKGRIDVFLDPTLDPTGAGMHVLRSKEAIGSGQMTGKGYFTEGTLAQLKYVPERHTDFVFSSIAEGIGFVGGVILIAVFFLLLFRWLWVALRSKDHMGTCIAIGAMGMLLAHVFENIGMTIGLMPVTGIPLPFISYGGSNLLANMMAVGLVLNVWFRRNQRRQI
ncbi:MAG: rod shape-determining protein RodA [Eubacteriales bacterium]|nr:rod shape-determining protein RodA [Eubacteriales bacterium]